MALAAKATGQLEAERAQTGGLVSEAAAAVETTAELVKSVKTTFIAREGWALFSDMVGLTEDETDWQSRLHMAEIGEYDLANRPANSDGDRDQQALRTAKIMSSLEHEEDYEEVEDPGDTMVQRVGIIQ